jgi:hypothetical protein
VTRVSGVAVAVEGGVNDRVAVDSGVNECVAVGVVDALGVDVAGRELGLGEAAVNRVAVGVASVVAASSSAQPARTASNAAVRHSAPADAPRCTSRPFRTCRSARIRDI